MQLVVNPTLTTSGSMITTLYLLKIAGCNSSKALVLAAMPEGIAVLEKDYSDVELYSASFHQCLDKKATLCRV